MKKIVAVLLMLTLCSCSSNASTTEPQAEPTTTVAITETELTTEPPTEPSTTATEIPPAPTTEPPTEPEANDLLFNEQGIEIYYRGVDQNIVKLYIVNTSEYNPVHAWMRNISVNGNLLNAGCEGYADKNTENDWPCLIPLEELQSRDITRINELKFTLHISGESIVDTDEFTIVR